jgi:hypothetical protein
MQNGHCGTSEEGSLSVLPLCTADFELIKRAGGDQGLHSEFELDLVHPHMYPCRFLRSHPWKALSMRDAYVGCSLGAGSFPVQFMFSPLRL